GVPILPTPLRAGFDTSRRATTIVDPQGGPDYARRAGPAAVRRDVYDGDSPTMLCYGGSLIGFQREGREIIFVGASDPFRHDRIGEGGNAGLGARARPRR